jgi:anaerobic selenocysteine-containing dehydrogenase
LYLLANNPVIDPLGEALPNSEIFRRLAAKMGYAETAFRDPTTNSRHRPSLRTARRRNSTGRG